MIRYFFSFFSVLILLYLSSVRAWGAGTCHLQLVHSSEEVSLGVRKTSVPESLRALYFLRNLKRLGFEAESTNADGVREELEAQSDQNLKSYIQNFNQWLLGRGILERRRPEDRGEFRFWKERFSPPGGIPAKNLSMDSEVLNRVSASDQISFWSSFAGGLDGVAFNLEEMDSSPEKLVQSSQSNGTARIALRADLSKRWMFVLPGPGESFGTQTLAGLNSYLGFLTVFAPRDFKALMNHLRFYLSEKASPGQLMPKSFSDQFLLIAKTEQGQKRLHLALRSLFRGQVLTIEDGERLLRYVRSQLTHLTLGEGFSNASYAHLNNLVAYVSGPVLSLDFVMFERPFVPPSISSTSRLGEVRRPPGLEGDKPPAQPEFR